MCPAQGGRKTREIGRDRVDIGRTIVRRERTQRDRRGEEHPVEHDHLTRWAPCPPPLDELEGGLIYMSATCRVLCASLSLTQ